MIVANLVLILGCFWIAEASGVAKRACSFQCKGDYTVCEGESYTVGKYNCMCRNPPRPDDCVFDGKWTGNTPKECSYKCYGDSEVCEGENYTLDGGLYQCVCRYPSSMTDCTINGSTGSELQCSYKCYGDTEVCEGKKYTLDGGRYECTCRNPASMDDCRLKDNGGSGTDTEVCSYKCIGDSKVCEGEKYTLGGGRYECVCRNPASMSDCKAKSTVTVVGPTECRYKCSGDTSVCEGETYTTGNGHYQCVCRYPPSQSDCSYTEKGARCQFKCIGDTTVCTGERYTFQGIYDCVCREPISINDCTRKDGGAISTNPVTPAKCPYKCIGDTTVCENEKYTLQNGAYECICRNPASAADCTYINGDQIGTGTSTSTTTYYCIGDNNARAREGETYYHGNGEYQCVCREPASQSDCTYIGSDPGRRKCGMKAWCSFNGVYYCEGDSYRIGNSWTTC